MPIQDYSMRAFGYEFVCWNIPTSGGAVFRHPENNSHQAWVCATPTTDEPQSEGLRHFRGLWWKYSHTLTQTQVVALPIPVGVR